MKDRRTIWQWLRDWWTPDDEEDADGYPGEECPMCGGEGGWLELGDFHTMIWRKCPACNGTGKVQ